MALDEDLRRIMGFDQGPDNNAEVTFKIKPLGSVAAGGAMGAPSPAQASASGMGAGESSGVSPGPGSPLTGIGPPEQPGMPMPTGFGEAGQSIVPMDQRRANVNPTLVTHPLGAKTDSIYEAAVAQLANQSTNQYMDILKDIGFLDDQGNFVPGLLETEAIRGRSDLNRQRDLALQGVDEAAVNRGTVFSGRRATLQGQAQAPYNAALSNLETMLGRSLSDRYQGLSRTTQGFEVSRNMLIAEAAQRIAMALQGGPSGPGGPPPSGPPAGPPPAGPPPPMPEDPYLGFGPPADWRPEDQDVDFPYW